MDTNYEKLFEEFYYDYQRTQGFSDAMNQEIDYDKYKIISIDFFKWLVENGHIKKK